MLRLVSLFLLTVLFSCSPDSRHPADFVWVDPSGEGRQVYAVFRLDCELNNTVSGRINLFADSRYILLVNGVPVNFGPARSYPEHPEYDTYNIVDFLIEGKNVIAVKVLSNGMNTFQLSKSIGGFISWGEIQHEGGKIDLSTPGNWKCKRLVGYDPTSPKISFATGVLESYDARKEPQNWMDPGIDLADWNEPVLINQQDHWGTLEPRSIPHLTQDEIPAQQLLGAYTLKQDEDIHSFRIKIPDETRKLFGANKREFAYTYIYSPKPQKVSAGLWWGEFWLNGEGPLRSDDIVAGKPNRQDIELDLKDGWNWFFIKYGIVWGCWDFYMAVPRSAGLELSPVKEPDSEYDFMTAGPFTDEEEPSVLDIPLPFNSPGDLPELSAGWVGQKRGKTAGNPAWEIAWSYFEKPLEFFRNANSTSMVQPGPLPPSGETQITIDHTGGSALIYDMGGKTLGRIFVDYETLEGTIIDVGFAEDLDGNRPWILKRAGIFTATRHISSGGPSRLETFKPYGAKFLQVNVTNNSGPVRINKVGMISQTYPFEKVGSFECSDPMLNRIWEMGWRTLRVCSEDTYTDTPFRERGLYAGDALPEYAITLATSGDSRLIKRCVRVFADMYVDLMYPAKGTSHESVNHMIDFPLITLQFFAWSVNRTGDMEFAEKYYDGYRNMMETILQNKNSTGRYDQRRAFIEWTSIDRNAELTAVQSLIAAGFESMAYLAGLLGKQEDVDIFSKAGVELTEVINRTNWDKGKSAFHDGFKEGEMIPHHYPISSAWPVLFGQTSDERNSELVPFFDHTLSDIGDVDRQRLATPYGGFYLLSALGKMEQARIAEDFIRKYWSPMVLKYDDTAWENFGDGSDGEGQGTLSHAWSGGPTYYMSRHILGVDMGWPEFTHPDTLIISPLAETVGWARGDVPHARGVVHVEWKIQGDTLFLNSEVPDGVEWRVEPKGRLAELELVIN